MLTLTTAAERSLNVGESHPPFRRSVVYAVARDVTVRKLEAERATSRAVSPTKRSTSAVVNRLRR